MKWCRFQRGEQISHGIVEEDGRIVEVAGSPLGEHTITGTSYQPDQIKLLAPIIPPMLYAAGPNYRGHVEGMAARRGAAPVYPAIPEPNFRSVHAIIGPDDNILVPTECSGALQPDGQLAVVMGKKARKVSKEEALDCVFGYTIGNDISQRMWQSNDRTMFRGKNCDTFKPLGPWIGPNPA